MGRPGRIPRDIWRRKKNIEEFEAGRIEPTKSTKSEYESDIIAIGELCTELLKSKFAELLEIVTNERALLVAEGLDPEVSPREDARYQLGVAKGLRMTCKSFLQWEKRGKDILLERKKRINDEKNPPKKPNPRGLYTDDPGL